MNDRSNRPPEPPTGPKGGGGQEGARPQAVLRRRPYAAAARISHTGNEFIIDFGDTDPDNPQMIMMHTGVKMSPQTAKGLLIALRQNLQKYEEKYGRLGYPPDDADDLPDWSKPWN